MASSDMIDDPNFKKWADQFKTRAEGDFYARQSWARFKELGFTDLEISLGFYLACDFPNSPGYEALAELREESLRNAQKAKRLILRLETDRNQLCELFKIRRPAASPKTREPILGEKTDASDLMTSIEDIFSRPNKGAPEQNVTNDQILNCNPVNGGSELSGARIDFSSGSETIFGNAGQTQSPVRSAPSHTELIQPIDLAISKLRLFEQKMRQFASKRTATPSFFVALGISLIKETAKQSHYRDYANLLNVANQVFGHDELLVGEDAVRKTFQRFMKRDPHAFEFELSPEAAVFLAIVLFAQFFLQKGKI
jgi:hypothetical protein